MPELSSEKFEFNIDSNGTMWQISKLRDGGGLLVLDKDENSEINDGSELFGTKSRNGFSDLAKFDDDGNGWIDKNDAIFNNLRIWQKTDTKDRLIALGEVGIGTIFLGSVKSEFSLGFDSKLGQLRSSGFFLKDSGEAGLITQIDLAKDRKVEVEKAQPNDMQTRIKKFIKNIDELSKNLKESAVKISQNKLEFKTINPLEIEPKESQKILQNRFRYLKNRLARECGASKQAIKSHIMALEGQLSNIKMQSAIKF